MKSLGDPLLANYSAFFSSSGYVAILGQTFQIAAMVTVSCALLGYPYAYLMSRVGSLARIVLIGVVLLPVWTSFLVR
ncbi:ABC transporter permease, partial [Kocuria oceani]